jgi:probable rRNA maturation factor
MFSFQLINHPESFIVDEVRLFEIFRHISKNIDIPQKGILNIAFLPDNEIQVLNKQYRNIDSSTDVLSFHYFDNFSDISDDEIGGEIILSE